MSLTGEPTGFSLTPRQFGPLWKYICQDQITNLDWDSGQLWIKYANQVRQPMEDPLVTPALIERFSLLVANHESQPFNPVEMILSAETEQLRITFVHEAFAVSGRSMSIRKSLPRLRFTVQEALDRDYCQDQVLQLLVNCVLKGYNFVFCGEPGQGKTEAAKFFSSFIPANQKVITVEELREWHYQAINPGKDCVELKIRDQKEYGEAIAVALRLNPKWIMMAETRSREVRYLLESWSNGVNCMTTLHVNDARRIPDRILNMLETRLDADRLVNQIYSDVGIGVLLRECELAHGITCHQIWQVCFYYRREDQNGMALVVEDGRWMPERMPEFLAREIRTGCGEADIYRCSLVEQRRREGR